MGFARQVTGAAFGKSVYPEYDAADLGPRGYWYPAALGGGLRGRPVSVRICGQSVMLIRDGGRVRALQDRCPHRGIPLSVGRREFPGTISCCYHGWTYDLASGELLAALTDGPESPICGAQTVRVRTYPVQERAGIVWVYIGDGQPPPLEADVPEEMLEAGTTVVGRVSERSGDWRHAAENGFDEGHAKYLHRTSPWSLLRYLPAWSEVRTQPRPDGKWLDRVVTRVGYRSEFKNAGPWPAVRPWWKFIGVARKTGGPEIWIRMPCVLRVNYPDLWWIHFEWYVPVDRDRYRYFQIMVNRRKSAVTRLRLHAGYWLYHRWIFHLGLFNQDDFVVKRMRTPPEQLYRPDVSIVGWRRFFMEQLRRRQAETEGAAPVAGADAAGAADAGATDAGATVAGATVAEATVAEATVAEATVAGSAAAEGASAD